MSLFESQEVQELLDNHSRRSAEYARDNDRSLQMAGAVIVRHHPEIRRPSDAVAARIKAEGVEVSPLLKEVGRLLDELRHDGGRFVAHIQNRETILARDRKMIEETRERGRGSR